MKYFLLLLLLLTLAPASAQYDLFTLQPQAGFIGGWGQSIPIEGNREISFGGPNLAFGGTLLYTRRIRNWAIETGLGIERRAGNFDVRLVEGGSTTEPLERLLPLTSTALSIPIRFGVGGARFRPKREDEETRAVRNALYYIGLELRQANYDAQPAELLSRTLQRSLNDRVTVALTFGLRHSIGFVPNLHIGAEIGVGLNPAHPPIEYLGQTLDGRYREHHLRVSVSYTFLPTERSAWRKVVL